VDKIEPLNRKKSFFSKKNAKLEQKFHSQEGILPGFINRKHWIGAC
jgi:hypothetical protein